MVQTTRKHRPRHSPPVEAAQAFLESTAATDGLQIAGSCDPAMPPNASFPLNRAATAPGVPELVRARMATFPGRLEECFSAGLALKLLGRLSPPTVDALVARVEAHRLPYRVRYHYFDDPRTIAVDTDTTGVCLTALWRAGRIDADTLYRGAVELLRAGAAEYVSADDNRSHGGENGELPHRVPKAYWDDHDTAQVRHRGRKVDAFVLANALAPVMLALQHTRLDADRPIELRGFRPDGTLVEDFCTAGDVVFASLRWLERRLSDEPFGHSHYYQQPELLLGLVADLCSDGGPLTASLATALDRRTARTLAPLDGTPIALAGWLIAAARVDHPQIGAARAALLASQEADGGWPAQGIYRLRTQPLYFGSRAQTTLFALRALEDTE